MAGRSLDRALKKLHSSHNKSSSSLKSMSSDNIHTDNVSSRPVTPGTEPPPSPAIFEQLRSIESAHAAAKSDNAFLRNLVEQNTKEKAVFITTVENLQAEIKSKLSQFPCIRLVRSIRRSSKPPLPEDPPEQLPFAACELPKSP